MKLFACVLDTSGHGIPAPMRRLVESAPMHRRLAYRWDTCDHAAVLTAWDDDGGEIRFERTHTHIAIGQVRLDNREEVAALAEERGAEIRRASDLALALRAVARHGIDCLAKVIGDFAFVVWEPATRTAIAACDAFATRPMYYAQRDGLTLFGSRAEPLSVADHYDVAVLGEMVTYGTTTRHRTVYANVACMRPASYIIVRRHSVTTGQYWSAMDCALSSEARVSESDAIDACRDLVAKSVRLRLDPGGHTWAQLSGGLDSSTVVSVAGWLAERGEIQKGLDGSLTYVFSADAGGDERPFSEQVLQRWPIRNEAIVEPPMFCEADGAGLTLPDQPIVAMVLAPMHDRACRVLRDNGARVLLTGQGGDELLTGDMMYFADRLAKGRVLQALGDMAHIAALGRISFWRFAYKSALVPMLPPVLRRVSLRDMNVTPGWVRRDTLRRAGLSGRISDTRYNGPVGRKYAYWHASEFSRLDRHDDWAFLGDIVSVRHPFLYRPLVEFALRLPPEFCVRPYARKWVLRQAMQGILPEGVRNRVGKGGSNAGLARLYSDRLDFFREIARAPILADLGVVDAAKLTRAVEKLHRASGRQHQMQALLTTTLNVELWLQRRAGRWAHGLVAPKERTLSREAIHA